MKKFSVICLTVILIAAVAPVKADICVLSLDGFSLDPATDPGWSWPGNQRWKDIAGNMYDGELPSASTSWRSDAYDRANVSVDYQVVGSLLTGTVTGTGLKPNFAYQLKLEGLLGGSPAESWTNSTLRSLGRTTTDGKNMGYLPFGYIVTDGDGSVAATFATDSSYHVLMRTAGSGGYGIGSPGTNDGPVTNYTFAPAASSPWYATDLAEGTVGVYGQWQTDRALPGELLLPDGTYVCNFVLTEESFHDTGGTFHPGWDIYSGAPGGSWASPFKGNIAFTVPAVPVPGAVVLGAIGIGYANWRLRRRKMV